MKVDLPGRRVEWFPSLDSTMIVAARLAREGCASGTVVGADDTCRWVGVVKGVIEERRCERGTEKAR